MKIALGDILRPWSESKSTPSPPAPLPLYHLAHRRAQKGSDTAVTFDWVLPGVRRPSSLKVSPGRQRKIPQSAVVSALTDKETEAPFVRITHGQPDSWSAQAAHAAARDCGPQHPSRGGVYPGGRLHRSAAGQ